jgi:2-polyprenyl-3-methyl-5-hydroxy-6-metoxy-1,4-benzoquinol methylase
MDRTQQAVAVFDKNAVLYQDRFMDFELHNDTFDLFCTQIQNKDADILDIASGPGNITKYLLQQRPDFKIMGIDLAPKMIELAKVNNPNAQFLVMDCRDIGQLPQKYDGIICGFGLPYLSKDEAIQLIKDASFILKPKGVLYLSTMEDDNNKSDFKTGSTGDQIFMNYHQADYLTTALKESGFYLIDIRRKDYQNPDGTISVDLVLIARTQNPLPRL